MGLADLSSILWRERELLELLLFKLEEEQLVLAAHRSRWLAHATREVELVLEQIRLTEVMRSAEVATVASELGFGVTPSLSDLADAAGQPWQEILHEHRKAFMTLTAEIQSMAEVNKGLLVTGSRAVRETLLSVVDTVQTYGRRGEAFSAGGATRLVDEAI